MPGPLIVDVTSDIVCPWCFIGKRRLEQAATILEREIAIRWHPFELNPGIPREGMARREYRIAKFGSWEYSRQLDASVAENGRSAGIEFRHDLMQRTPNSFRGHVLMAAALERDVALQNTVAERLFTGYFCRGEDVGDPAVLASIAHEFGVDADFDDPALMERVREEEIGARDNGVTGVPFIQCQGQLVSEGAAPPEALAAALRYVAQNGEG
ncbi:MAG TPA: DsbA family oxidoreductase [Bryobacteraceae bacterium]|jgi:predicted DsbA family dithiol-disulfide isomerase|nr:DsbA family oxidoreductase [Bryobacteraceae bacterium]